MWGLPYSQNHWILASCFLPILPNVVCPTQVSFESRPYSACAMHIVRSALHVRLLRVSSELCHSPCACRRRLFPLGRGPQVAMTSEATCGVLPVGVKESGYRIYGSLQILSGVGAVMESSYRRFGNSAPLTPANSFAKSELPKSCQGQWRLNRCWLCDVERNDVVNLARLSLLLF